MSDIVGIEEFKAELEKIIHFLKNKNLYKKIGAETPKGILLYGEPGVGKTMLAKALANESSYSFLYASGSEFGDKYIGGSARKVRRLFKQARKSSPCIVFIDEIDSIGAKRDQEHSNYFGGGNEGLNQLLHEMDGFHKSKDIIVIGATNRKDSLDAALLRAGRFDSHLRIPNLNKNGRIELIKKIATRVKLDNSIEFNKLDNLLGGFSGADLDNIFNLAALKSGFENKKKVNYNTLLNVISEFKGSNLDFDEKMNQLQNQKSAFREAAFAILMKNRGSIDKISELKLRKLKPSVQKKDNPFIPKLIKDLYE